MTDFNLHEQSRRQYSGILQKIFSLCILRLLEIRKGIERLINFDSTFTIAHFSKFNSF